MMDEIDRTAEELIELEGAAVAGETVTPAELSEARERVNLAVLVARGAASRAELGRAKVAAEVKEAAKVEAASASAMP